jgi:hypothetical protein
MKSFLDKFSANTSRYEVPLLVIPFILWIFCFRYFFTGHLALQADAIPYFDQINFYTENFKKGVFSLWDPTWFNGAPYHFFLRRFGDVNPLLFLIVFLKLIGVPAAAAYLVFLGVYYFLAGWAFYLIARLLFTDLFYAFSAYVLFLFSSWGSEVFYNYIIIVFVPIIWFFYFLLRFSRAPQKSSFLGLCFCLGLIATTYIPFFFLTIISIFGFFFMVFYGRPLMDFLKSSISFFAKNKFFTAFCLVFLLIACVPAIMFYKESKSGEFVLPDRHSGADVSSAVAVGLQNAASGDIISHGYFDRIFDDQEHLDMGDIYIPYIFFLVLLCATCARVNKLIFFLLFNILAMSLITITNAAGVHRFLYEHLLIFKFIRQIYYFFWLSMLPMLILLSVAAFKSLLTAISASSKKTVWLIYIVICHALFLVFLCSREGVLEGAWVAVLIALGYFLVYFLCQQKISYAVGFAAILLAVFLQSAQVYAYLDKKLLLAERVVAHPEQEHQQTKRQRPGLYYASYWYAILNTYLDPQIFGDYAARPFIFYDNVMPEAETPEFFKSLQAVFDAHTNIAFVPRLESKDEDWRKGYDAPVDLDPVASGALSLGHSDSNTWILKSHLSRSRFLVLNDNYSRDWHAFINGHEAHIFRANVSFKGLWVPAGDSDILLRFSTPKTYALHFALIAFFAGTFSYLLMLLKKEEIWNV